MSFNDWAKEEINRLEAQIEELEAENYRLRKALEAAGIDVQHNDGA